MSVSQPRRPPVARVLVLVSLSLGLAACGGAGGGGGGDWYYHFACNGDQECLTTNSLGTASGTIDVGPVESNCTSLRLFREKFWGAASWDACDQSPTFSPPGTGTPTITGVSPAVATQGTQVTITGSNFPASASDVTLEIGGVAVPSNAYTGISTAGYTTITFTVAYLPSMSGPITVHTPGGQATSSATLTILDDLAAVAWSGTRFVAVGAYGTALTSPDGLTWTARATGVNPLIASLSSVTWSGSKFIAGGTNGYIISSADGVAWTVPASGLGMTSINGIVFTGTKYVAVGTASALELSTDGSSWSPGSFGQPADAYLGLAWGNGLLVATGFGIVTSPDGTTWTQRITPSAPHDAVAWSGTTFVTVGSGGAVLTSPDGLTWTPRTSGTAAELRGVTWFNGRFIAVGAAGTVLTSPDGITWTPRSTGASLTLNGVAASGSKVVAVGNAGTTISSSDGIDWTSNLLPAPTGVGVSTGGPGHDPTVSWVPVAGATGYVVYASTGAVSKTSYFKRVTTTATSATVTGLDPGGSPTYWYFIVTAVNAYGEGPPSATAQMCVGMGICG